MKKSKATSDLGQELLEAAQEMLAHSRGEIELPTYHYSKGQPKPEGAPESDS